MIENLTIIIMLMIIKVKVLMNQNFRSMVAEKRWI